MGAMHFAGFDVVTRDISGYTSPLGSESIAVRFVGGADLSESPLTSNAEGFVEPVTLSATAGDQVEFYSATKAGVLRQFVTATAEEAYSVQVTLVLDDDFATTKTSEFAEIYLADNDEPTVPPRHLGTQAKGTVIKYAVESAFSKDYEIFGVSRTQDYEFATPLVTLAASDSVAPPSTRPADQIEVAITAVTAGTTNRLLYDNAGLLGEAIVGSGLSLSGGTLSATGSGITIGSTAISSGTNNRVLYQAGGVVSQSGNLTFDGTSLTIGSIGKITSPNSSTLFFGQTPHGSYSGTENISIGFLAGAGITSGTLNVLVGSRAGQALSTGVGNLFYGYAVAYPMTSGSYNIGIGYGGLVSNVSNCIAIGTNPLASASATGSYNIGIGERSGNSLTSGYNNTFIGGDYVGGLVSSGIGNTFIGYFAGSNVTTGDDNVAIGRSISLDSATGNNQTNINNTFIATSTEARIGGRNFKIEDGKNIIFDTTTGTKIGTSTSQKIGFFNATPVTQRGNIGALTDTTSGSAGSVIDDPAGGSDTVDVAVVNDNFKRLTDRINLLEQVLQDLGLTA